MFEKLRDGSLSLPQIIARIHLFQTGRAVAVLDDLRQDLHPSILVKPSRYVEAAYEDMVLEKNLHKTANKRGVDPAQLLESAKSISYNSKCIRSIYSKPKRRSMSPKT
jgi:hypothetical protein